MRATTLLTLALALSFGCKSTEEVVPTDSSTLPQDVARDVAADTQNDVAADVSQTDAADATVADATVADATDATDADGATDADVITADASDGASDAVSDVAADAAPSCVSDGGCSCSPTTSDEFINRCTGSTCSPFNNAARLPRLLPDGGRPPLP